MQYFARPWSDADFIHRQSKQLSWNYLMKEKTTQRLSRAAFSIFLVEVSQMKKYGTEYAHWLLQQPPVSMISSY